MNKLERLVNLIALLLNARRPIGVETIRNTVPGYQQDDYSSFKRMFERDKEELRQLGIPLERRFTDVWEVEEGYIIPKDGYYLPDIELTTDEYAALWIASRVVVEEGAKEDQALLKLGIGAGSGANPSSPLWLRARLYLDAPALGELLEAVAARRSVRFDYQPPKRSKPSTRTVDPYGLVHRQFTWYLIGYDQARRDVRHFKLTRIASDVRFVHKGSGPDFEVPDGFSAEGRLSAGHWIGDAGIEAEVALSPVVAWQVEQSLGLSPQGIWRGWPVFKISVADEDGFMSWVLGFGRDAVLRSPERLRKTMVQRLRQWVPVCGTAAT